MRSRARTSWQTIGMMVGIAALVCPMAGCKKGNATSSSRAASTNSERIPAMARQEAQQIFATRCTPCHGAQGRGDGPASKGLNPKPRNYTDLAWQKSVNDEHLEKIIVYGGAAVGKSPAMPANPDLQGKEDVVRALRAHIRKLGQQ